MTALNNNHTHTHEYAIVETGTISDPSASRWAFSGQATLLFDRFVNHYQVRLLLDRRPVDGYDASDNHGLSVWRITAYLSGEQGRVWAVDLDEEACLPTPLPSCSPTYLSTYIFNVHLLSPLT